MFDFDLNNALLLCKGHFEWYKTELLPSYELLFETHPVLANFHLSNRARPFEEPVDYGEVKRVLLEAKNDAIKNPVAPFPSIYGNFEVD
jgi:hypothetical protein